MNETFPIEFFGGSTDGALIDGNTAPQVFVVNAFGNVKEIYARQTEEPPFVYVQIGYAEDEKWKP
jgi:hypothetical protein